MAGCIDFYEEDIEIDSEDQNTEETVFPHLYAEEKMTSDTNDAEQEIERMKKRLAREKKARQQAEILLEEKSQELYEINT